MATPVLNFPFLSGTDKYQKSFADSLLLPEQLMAAQLSNKILGPQAKYAEPLTRNELLAKELANRINQVKANYAEPTAKEALRKSQLENEWYVPKTQSEIGLAGAQAGHYGELSKNLQFDRQNPLLLAPDTKTLGALLADPRFKPIVENYLKGQGQQMPQQQGIEHDPNQLPSPLGSSPQSQNLGAPNIQSRGEKLVSQYLDRQGQKPGGIKEWDRLPAPIKNAEIAQARGFGYNDTEAVRLYREGYDQSELAKMKGFSPDGSDWPESIYNVAPQTIARQQRANIAQAGIEELEPRIAKDLAPYAKKWNGISLVQLHQSLRGKNDEEIGKAIGAAAVAHELAALRLTSGGITPGIGALKKSLEASHTDLTTPGLSLTPKQIEVAQKYIGKAVRDLNTAENKAAFGHRGKSNISFSHLSDEELEKIAGGY